MAESAVPVRLYVEHGISNAASRENANDRIIARSNLSLLILAYHFWCMNVVYNTF